jgi:hypothetical protein
MPRHKNLSLVFALGEPDFDSRFHRDDLFHAPGGTWHSARFRTLNSPMTAATERRPASSANNFHRSGGFANDEGRRSAAC